MAYKTTFFINCGKQGVQESWFIDEASLADADTGANACQPQRQALLGKGSYIEAIRTVDLSTPGAALFTQYAAPTGVAEALRRDNPANCIQVRVSAVGSYRRTMLLRSVPDDWIGYTLTNQRIIDPEVRKRVSAFLKKAGSRGFGLRAISTDPAVNIPRKVVGLGIDVASGFVEVTTSGAHGFTAGQYVRINRIKGTDLQQVPPLNKKINSIWQVALVPTPLTFCLPTTSADFSNDPAWYGGGLVRARWRVDNAQGGSFAMPRIVDGEPLRFMRKKAGRAFFVQAGRQRALRR